MKMKYLHAYSRSVLLGLSMAVLLVCQPIYAHPATERYIPIGYWSLVGGQKTYVGSLSAFTVSSGTMAFSDGGRTHEVNLAEDTKIWIDRSHLNLATLDGNPSDIHSGMKVEIKMKAGSEQVAEWVKIQGSR